MLWFVSNVGNVSDDGRLAGLVIGAKSDRGRVSTHINSIGRREGRGGMKFKTAFILKRIRHLQNTLKNKWEIWTQKVEYIEMRMHCENCFSV